MKTTKISILSKALIVLASICLLISLFVPIWRIELDAPQYPEGLVMLIYADKLGGAVDIINGLNHYIGMQTLHAENFIEFTVLPYIIGAYALLCLVTALVGRKKMLYSLFVLFVAFGILAMVDFWRWEYNYGHNLDPSAAIVVPGMSYQPPLIGFKQLLNFGAYSIPALGGWLFIGSGLLMLITVLIETKFLARFKSKNVISTTVSTVILFMLLSSCSSGKPTPIKLNSDNCDFCKMSISDGRFGAEVITKNGRVYKFDDLACMLRYKDENSSTQLVSFFIHDYFEQNILIPAETAFFVSSEEFKSPMRGNIAAFSAKVRAETFAKKYNSTVSEWKQVLK